MQPGPLEPGAVVAIREQRWRVERAEARGDVTRVDAISLSRSPYARHATFLAPFDRIRLASPGRPMRVRTQCALAHVAALVATTDRIDLPLAAGPARVNLFPHQLEPALAMLAGARRLLLADEVGLGKTVEAGLVLAELQRRRPGIRAIAAVPSSVRDQWADELQTRFALPVRIGDAASLARAQADLARTLNPWTLPGVWIVSLDYLKQPHVLDGLPPIVWDVVLIDEAHAACGESERRRAAARLTQSARHVLLLTATPDSGDPRARQALLALGALPQVNTARPAAGTARPYPDGGAGTDDDPLVVFRRTRRDIGWPETRRVRQSTCPPSAAEVRLFSALTDFEDLVLSRVSPHDRDGATLLLAVLRKRALSTASALKSTIARRLAWLDSTLPRDEWRQALLAFDEGEDSVADDVASALTMSTGLAGDEERRKLGALAALADKAARDESKLRRLCALLARTSEPAVVFTEFRDTQTAIVRRLAGRATLAIVHGGLTCAEQRRALAAFASGARVLLATDVASQGLNLQARARWVINVDVPWNPVRLEQRAGRVDRLGQHRPVHITILTLDHPAERALLARVAGRAGAAGRAMGDVDLFGAPFPRNVSRPPTTPRTWRHAPSWNRHSRGLCAGEDSPAPSPACSRNDAV